MLQKWFTIYKKFPEIPVEKQMDHVFSDSSGGKFQGEQNVWKGISDFLVGNTYSAYVFRKEAMQFLKVCLILDPDLLSFPMDFNTARKSETKINGGGGIV